MERKTGKGNPLEPNNVLEAIEWSGVRLFRHATQLNRRLSVENNLQPVIDSVRVKQKQATSQLPKMNWKWSISEHYRDAAISRHITALQISPCDRYKQIKVNQFNESKLEIDQVVDSASNCLTTPMMDESNWASQRRRISAAFRTTRLLLERSSFLAMLEISISLLPVIVEIKKKKKDKIRVRYFQEMSMVIKLMRIENCSLK